MMNTTRTEKRLQEATAKADHAIEPFTLVLFGASGDLTQRMVMPAIFRLARRGILSPEFRLIGYARTQMSDDEFRAQMQKAVMREAREGDEQVWTDFAPCLSYLPAQYDGLDLQGYTELAPGLSSLIAEQGRARGGSSILPPHLLCLVRL